MMSAGGTSNLRELEDHKAKHGLIGPALPEQEYGMVRIPTRSGRGT